MRDSGPRVIAWEVTRRCGLDCRHCRGAARDCAYHGELTTRECHRVIDGILAFSEERIEKGPTILIFTGGEPMMRDDLVELVRHASDGGLRTVMAPCGHLLTGTSAAALKTAGIQCLSLSFDGPDAETHDAFRGVQGAFERSLQGLRHAQDAGIPIQVNTTVTQRNVAHLSAMLDFAAGVAAVTLDLFFLVPVGRGAGLTELALSARETERAVQWIARAAKTAPLRLKTTCAPQFARIAGPRGGCMAGTGFVFISHKGVLQPCGFLDVPCGDLRVADFDFGRLYRASHVFNLLRDHAAYKGKCGVCEFVDRCGGCRAKAYAATGDFMAAEETCAYQPGSHD